jgi:hypothetical protein
MRRDPVTREPQTEEPHKHEWKRADDWDWGPGTVTYECVPCRGLRVIRLRKPAALDPKEPS